MDKVSIVSPCYNGEKFISRFLDAILKQTYNNIQLIVVDDGSTDNTLELMRNYVPAFEKRGYEYIVLSQKNGGQAKAINNGLKVADGKYLAWPDSDDFLFPESVEKRVKFLQDNPNYRMVLSNGNEYAEEDLSLIRTSVVKQSHAESLLENLLDMTAVFNNNGYLIYLDDLFKIYPNKQIYESRAGQNIQILLALALKFKCGFLDEVLYGRTIRKNSHSKQSTDFSKRNAQIDDIYYNTLLSVSKDVSLPLIRYAGQRAYSIIVNDIESGKEIGKTRIKELKAVLKKLKSYKRKIWIHKVKKCFMRKKCNGSKS